MDGSPPGSSVHGILQARVLDWVAISFSRWIFPTQRSNPGLPHYRQWLYRLSHQGSRKVELLGKPKLFGSRVACAKGTRATGPNAITVNLEVEVDKYVSRLLLTLVRLELIRGRTEAMCDHGSKKEEAKARAT